MNRVRVLDMEPVLILIIVIVNPDLVDMIVENSFAMASCKMIPQCALDMVLVMHGTIVIVLVSTEDTIVATPFVMDTLRMTLPLFVLLLALPLFVLAPAASTATA